MTALQRVAAMAEQAKCAVEQAEEWHIPKLERSPTPSKYWKDRERLKGYGGKAVVNEYRYTIHHPRGTLRVGE